MSQHDFNIANQTAAPARADINSALTALASLSSGATAPSTTVANMLWYDTSTDTLKLRNEADSGWISIGYADQSSGAFALFDNAKVVNTSGTQTGLIGDQATSAWEAGTSTTESLVSPAKVKAAIEELRPAGIPTFTSSEIDFGSGIKSVAHGLGRTPASYEVVLRCKVANNGYSVGDEINVTAMVDGDGARGYVTWANATTLSASNQAASIQSTSGNYAVPTASNWKYVFYAW